MTLLGINTNQLQLIDTVENTVRYSNKAVKYLEISEE
jgi:hypothetical protein